MTNTQKKENSMLKRFLPVFLLAVAALTSNAANGMKTFKLNQEMHAVKAGTVITVEAEFESDPGYVLAGWSANIIRKNAAPEFFAKPDLKIRPHRTHKDYDAVDFVRYTHFPVAQTKGKFVISINTAGMPVGEYAIAIQGRWMKDNKSTYPGATLYVSITEADNGKFSTTAQTIPPAFKKPRLAAATPAWCKSLKVTPNPVTVKSGEKIAFSCDYAAKDGEFYGGFIVVTLRKHVPKAFFDLNNAKVRKHATAPDYDSMILLPFKSSANLPATKINFELDTTGYPAGDYDILLQIRVVKADGKTAYPSYPITVTVTK